MWLQTILRRLRPIAPSTVAGPGEETPLSLSPQVLHQLNRLHLNAGRHLSGRRVGQRSSYQRRPMHDFREHRMYVPGDDMRYVDWKASARSEHVFIRQGEQMRDATVSLLIDCSPSMDWGAPPKRQMAIQLAAALGLAALSHGDRLVVQPLSANGQKRLGPVSGKGQVPTLLNYLRRLEGQPAPETLSEAVRTFAGQVAGGLVLILSDLLDMSDFGPALALLPAPTWDVVVLHLLHPEELSPTLRGDFQMVDVEDGRTANYDVNNRALEQYQAWLALWLDGIEATCAAHSVFYTLLSTDASLAQDVLPRLRALRVLVPR